MADALLLEDLVHGNKNAALLHIAKFIIDSGAEELHRRAQVHVGIDQRRNVVAELTHLMVEQPVVFLEIILIEELLELILRRVDLYGLDRNDKMLIVSEMLAEEVENHVTSSADERRVHRHLPKEILATGIDDGERA